jgi:hypothetical protein
MGRALPASALAVLAPGPAARPALVFILKLVGRLEFGSGAVAMRYEPRR